MTVANEKSGSAMQQVLDNLKELPTGSVAKDIDLIFLRGIMESRIVRSLAKAHERLEEVKLEAVRDDNVQLISEILDALNKLPEKDAATAELTQILGEPHFKSLIEAHDQVAAKCYEVPHAEVNCTATLASCLMPADAIRMIGIQKKAGEPLGVTFRMEQGEMVIARILHDSSIDRQGMLHIGDVIREVNGCQVGGDPQQLQEILRDCSGSVTLKVLPSYKDSPALQQVYLKAHFNYNPASDNLIPCKEAGLAFSKGDIMHIVNKEDPNWWQARSVVGGTTGLIPSQFLEEKRKAFVRKDWDLSGKGMLCGNLTAKKKKKKMMYLTAKNAEFDRYELQIYEEVAKMPPFQRKTLVLIGAQGVGRRSLKNRLIVINPLRYGTTVPFTSRSPREEERDGQNYCFVTRSQMEQDIKDSRFLEHGEYDGNLYGTKIDSIHQVVGAGRTCILDVNPQALKVLKTAEFMPFVVFIAAPELDTLRDMHKAVVDAGLTTKLLTENDLKKTVEESARIRRAYSHFFDLTIYNDNLDKAFDQLQEAVERLLVEPQWVPVSWVY
ncbi:MAGUK p55 subfamily member 6a isoform X1 [Phyllopteryx taeniolatus]|uniref:MAGUK p55 subfamily member 6a isoform X1 n=1 Tax=Phyllopteryx taeniolatus TaxID=161469 RepID=UPI002AD53200|nr:MAGUK p55 subfamily member 6a isoform X1 [Phyllopteryx taeniolatus]XP_061632548.1 MAGUK p55 subfamily member 6a isoform X1 [Phyllopteryx taeniolatus]XP_061632549.1 MAGUK p55 subfamily member 6a isoform X1 [Phyllopteryx taeniolatus]XP_061632550.1 MAGUK p55 subfamily member 6a isoform X1 [Phyllopteryx taeniolatus]XP_061632551.1 MAGUK p55 subfamily member 6a isoform X1 [Phyllopteryx taeniolatus]XP_061632552.1 MAGUK p55 subfamily member 6a isoform X1 [Phyllopteryx taeniolatus]XP_061632553.1 MA